MAAPKRPTHEMVHPKRYLKVDGKLQHVPAGTPLTLTDEQAKAAGNTVRSLSDKKSVDMTDEESSK